MGFEDLREVMTPVSAAAAMRVERRTGMGREAIVSLSAVEVLDRLRRPRRAVMLEWVSMREER
jgi:hypothetical protein